MEVKVKMKQWNERYFLSLYILYKKYHSQRVVMVINLIFGVAMYIQSNFPLLYARYNIYV